MKKMNNKGQVLVCFVIIIPILFMLVALVVNLGIFSIEKRKLSNVVQDTIKYGLNHIDDNNIQGTLTDLIIKNDPKLNKDNIKIIIDNNEIAITVLKDYHGLFKYLVNNQKLNISYKGHIIDSKIIITKEG